MSRIGKKPVTVPSGVKVALDPRTRTLSVEGPKGKLQYVWHPKVSVRWEEGEKRVVCSIPQEAMDDRKARALWGTTRARIANCVQGVSQGYMKKLEVVGVGWNAKLAGRDLQLTVGYCNPLVLSPPTGVEFKIEGPMITITGPDKQAVGEFAAVVRSKRPPEPYNGKGIKYVGEVITRKQGKVFGA